MRGNITVGVLALQGAFNEHIQLLRQAAKILASKDIVQEDWTFLEIRTPKELERCDALIIPGGESTTMSLVAERSGMLEPLREFVKVHRHPTWGTCAGLILLSESANRTKKGGQELIGGLDVRVNRNHFGRQIESFQASLDLPFLASAEADSEDFDTSRLPFQAIFIRAPIVEKILKPVLGVQVEEIRNGGDERVVAPSREIVEELKEKIQGAEVEVLGVLPSRNGKVENGDGGDGVMGENEVVEKGDIVAVRQANVFGTSFHPELTGDPRIHVWWLREVVNAVEEREKSSKG